MKLTTTQRIIRKTKYIYYYLTDPAKMRLDRFDWFNRVETGIHVARAQLFESHRFRE